jgi:sugar O-acyltransferase (sialic acid O-acetyltransferase NeuD family)
MKTTIYENVVLYGASGHAKVIIDILASQNIAVTALFDDNEAIIELLGIPVFHDLSIKSPLIISIGSNNVRKKIVEKINAEYAKAIHSSAIISPFSEVALGTVVMQGAIIQSSTQIGQHCIINTGASIDHDCTIDDFVHISPRATLCGNVSVGEGTWIGAGTTIIQGVKIGKWSVIGAGSVVTKDIPDGVLAVGNRCKVIKEL